MRKLIQNLFLRTAARKTVTAISMAAAMVMGFEGYELATYKDTGGVITVCYGHTGPELRMGQTYTEAQCYEYLEEDLAVAHAALQRLVKVPIPMHVEAALIDFVYNVGQGQFASSTLLKKLNRGDIVGACNELPRWVYDNGVKLNGLVTRRNIEKGVCLGELDVRT